MLRPQSAACIVCGDQPPICLPLIIVNIYDNLIFLFPPGWESEKARWGKKGKEGRAHGRRTALHLLDRRDSDTPDVEPLQRDAPVAAACKRGRQNEKQDVTPRKGAARTASVTRLWDLTSRYVYVYHSNPIDLHILDGFSQQE